ncbi:MAG TPA: phosphate ABC transporter substrate-binding protein PstS [Polyangiaceae bacterium]|nr:phosphate ABC transporter substrate-binding protein PstS [Polyangiaceae bacterium]
MLARRNLLVGLLLGLIACKESQPAPAPSATEAAPVLKQDEAVSLTGAGATFPYPLYSKWISEYNKLNPNVKINYQSIGSGGGIRQITANTVDFGATDAPMKEDEAKQASGKLFHIPATIGAVVVAYNLPEVTGTLKLSSEVLVDIYAGKVKRWNDPKLKADNADAKLPAKDISVVYRTDGSGTTAVFTEYLGKVSAEWKEKVGVGKVVRWPTGLGAKGNEGVTGQVKTTPYTIGYIERAYASQNKLPMAELRNKAGKFVAPSIEAMSAAANAVEMPAELVVSLANADGEGAYPITSYSYLLVYEDAKDATKGEALAKYVWWGLHDGQKFAKDLDYAPIPATVLSKVEARLRELRSGDRKLLSGA